MSGDQQIIVANNIALPLQCCSDGAVVSGHAFIPGVDQDSLGEVSHLLPVVLAKMRLTVLDAVTQFTICYGRHAEVSDGFEFYIPNSQLQS